MSEVKEPVLEALKKLEEMQSFETSYAQINKVQNIINTFANLDQVCESMAAEIARQTGRSREEVLDEYYRRAGLLSD
ncbi:MAG: hypothetical protein KBI24_10365 [Selenomonas sp.]|nr:hypothetical protein [Selenomonas sp.]